MRTRTVIVICAAFALGLVAGRSYPVERAIAASPESGAAAAATQASGRVEQPLPSGLTESERRDIEIFRRASPSTVFINHIMLRRDFLSLNVTRYQQGTGTGFVWDQEGHIVTNFHVIQTADPRTEYTVVLSDHSEWDARLVGRAPGSDLAVLKIEAPRDRLVPLALGSSEDLAVGQKVLALGNPFGLDQSLTTGIVSALGRDLESPDGRTIHDVIQTDAAINPGNSGGPLLDSSGRLIGVNTAITSPSGAYAGVGFAVPVGVVKRLVPELIQFGEPKRSGIGIQVVPDSIARQAGIDGVVVSEVLPGTPAERVGIKAMRRTTRGTLVEDVIIAVDGKRVRRLPELLDAFEEAGGVGAKIKLTLTNDGEQREVELLLVEVN